MKRSHVSGVEAGQGNLLTNTHHGLHNIFRYRKKDTLSFKKGHIAYARVEASLPSPSHRKDDILWCWMGRRVLE